MSDRENTQDLEQAKKPGDIEAERKLKKWLEAVGMDEEERGGTDGDH